MKKRSNIFFDYLLDESGATAIEYGLIAALIAVGIIGGAKTMTGEINSMFSDVDKDLGVAFGPNSNSGG